ncbi:MAG: aspartate aminotransferase family protein [Bryobacteraceae bacterium]
MTTSTETSAALSVSEQIIALEREYLLQNYGRYPLVLKRGRGCWLYDYDGKRYLDLLTGIGVNSLGHAHPRITRIIREQSGLLIHSSNLYYHEYQGKLAQKLVEISGLNRVFFCNSGTEAMEGAIKMIRSHGRAISPSKFGMVALENSFHGRTMGALSITGQPKYRAPFEPLLDGITFVPRQDDAALEAAVNENTAGIFIESIQGEGGIHPICERFMRKARELADRHNALLVFDEIQSGVGRPGTHFAYQLSTPAVMPDILAIAKPMACGLPLGAVIVNEKAAASIAPGMHGTTFGGGALACRVALEFFEILEGLMPQIQRVGEYFRDGLRQLAKRHSFITDVRGHGLMIGVETEFACKQAVSLAQAQGLLLNVTHDTVIRMLPPYIITEKEVDVALRGLGKVFQQLKPTA